MTENPSGQSTRRDQPQHTIDVPSSINMVTLLGPNDEHLGLWEEAFDADIHVRGNRVTLRGESAELALAERLVDELVAILRTGQGLTPEIVERAITMLRAESQERPADVLRSEEHTSELQSRRDLHSFPTRRSSDLGRRPSTPTSTCAATASPCAASRPSSRSPSGWSTSSSRSSAPARASRRRSSSVRSRCCVQRARSARPTS